LTRDIPVWAWVDDQTVCDRHPQGIAHLHAAGHAQSSRYTPSGGADSRVATMVFGRDAGSFLPAASLSTSQTSAALRSHVHSRDAFVAALPHAAAPFGPAGKARASSGECFWRRAGREGRMRLSTPSWSREDTPAKIEGDGRQATSHGFGNGHTERISWLGTDVEIGGRIEIENVRARGFQNGSARKCRAILRVSRKEPGESPPAAITRMAILEENSWHEELFQAL